MTGHLDNIIVFDQQYTTWQETNTEPYNHAFLWIEVKGKSH